MKKSNQTTFIAFVVITILYSGCAPSPPPNPTPIPPTITSSPILPTSTPTLLPTDTPVPAFTLTPEPSVEVFGPITYLEAFDLISEDYRVIGFNEINLDVYCEELITKANLPEIDLSACEFGGFTDWLKDVHIEGMFLNIYRDYKNMIWVEENVMQHKDGPALTDCYSDPPIGNLHEAVFIYETSSGNIRVIFAFYDTCTGAGIMP